MLQGAAAAGAEVWAGRRHALRRGLHNCCYGGLVMTRMTAQQPDAHVFSRQCARDEHRLARVSRHPTPVVGQTLDMEDLLRLCRIQLLAHDSPRATQRRDDARAHVAAPATAGFQSDDRLRNIEALPTPAKEPRMKDLAVRIGVLAFYAATAASFVISFPPFVAAVLLYGTLALLVAHTAEVLLCWRWVRAYPGPLVLSILLTLLFGFVHWMPYKRAAEAAGSA